MPETQQQTAYGQMIAVAHSSFFKAYLEVRRARPVNPMAPSLRGIINDQKMQNLLDFIRDSLTEYFTLKPANELNPEALQCFYRVYPDRARTLPVFVAARIRPFESGDDSNNIAQLSVPEVFTYDQQPLLLAECVKVVQEDGKILSDDYGLHTFLELTGTAYRVWSADESRLHIQPLVETGSASPTSRRLPIDLLRGRAVGFRNRKRTAGGMA